MLSSRSRGRLFVLTSRNPATFVLFHRRNAKSSFLRRKRRTSSTTTTSTYSQARGRWSCHLGESSRTFHASQNQPHLFSCWSHPFSETRSKWRLTPEWIEFEGRHTGGSDGVECTCKELKLVTAVGFKLFSKAFLETIVPGTLAPLLFRLFYFD